jgi:hypothetical protein
LDKLNLVKLSYGGEVLLITGTVATKNEAHFKSGQKRLENDHLKSMIQKNKMATKTGGF